MEWIEAKVDFDAATTVAAEELIADIFYDFGVRGVVVEDPTMESPPGTDVILEDGLRPTVNSVSGYFPAATFDQGQRLKFEEALKALGRQLTMRQRIFYRSLAEEDWAESWKAFFWPQKISSQIVVKPSWREYEIKGDERVLEIDPGMAFGTGAHPTTSLCVRLLEKHLRADDRLLDVGTGSGILMVAAMLIGAAAVHGIDKDPMAVDVARQNLVRNGVAGERSRVWTGDLVTGLTARYDLVVSNILTEVILGLLPEVPAVMAPEARFICSGILQNQQDKVVAKARTVGLRLIDALESEEWVAMAMDFGGPAPQTGPQEG
jgi:ribosomal protein L11 methyltransferase